MTQTESSKVEKALISVLGANAGVFVGTILQRLQLGLPVPTWVVNLLAGAGVFYFGGIKQTGNVSEFFKGFGTGHVIVGSFTGLKSITGSTKLPMISGMRGMRGLKGANLGNPAYTPTATSMMGPEDDSLMVSMTGPEEAKNTFSMY